MPSEFGKILIIVGILLVVVGLMLALKIQIPWLGKLPGDIHIKRDNFQFYFPIVTSILLSVLITVLIHLFKK
jgi:H+/Cl- antiporter ClcA